MSDVAGLVERLVERLIDYAKDQGGWPNIDETCEAAASALCATNSCVAGACAAPKACCSW